MMDVTVNGQDSSLGPDWDADEKDRCRRCPWDCRCEQEEGRRNPNFLVWATGWSVVGVIHRDKEQ